MANLNINGSVSIMSDVKISGSLTRDQVPSFVRNVDIMSQVNDTGWMELKGSPFMAYGDGGVITETSIRNFNNNYAKFRIVNNICYLAIYEYGTKIPVWIEGSSVSGLYLGILPRIICPKISMKWLANPMDSSGYEVQVTINTNGKIDAIGLGGKTKNIFCLYTSFPLDVFNYDTILRELSNYY